MHNFTPYSALIGGALIGLAAALMLLLSGRIAGVSGIVGSLLRPAWGDWGWRLAFVAGLVVAPLLVQWATDKPVSINIDSNLAVLVSAGLLVGFGTSLGSGCTSGHGVCGISRLSPRSILATVVFMAAGAATVYVMRHVVG